MKFKIEKNVFEKFPSLNVGIIVKGIDNTGENPEVLDSLKGESEKILSEYDMDSLALNPKIIAWREACRTFGAKPKKYKCSVENLYCMILEGI